MIKAGDLIKVRVWTSDNSNRETIGMVLSQMPSPNLSYYMTQLGEIVVPVHTSRIVEVLSESR
tara:strand:- start:57 stop:245 length:189 start_codon:yes stop_codon:yes gene_type:complete